MRRMKTSTRMPAILEHGFSLVELLIVIVILGVLAGVVVTERDTTTPSPPRAVRIALSRRLTATRAWSRVVRPTTTSTAADWSSPRLRVTAANARVIDDG
jgi:prepilin-type N-terminal cleavage/methylation domain-containing protein